MLSIHDQITSYVIGQSVVHFLAVDLADSSKKDKKNNNRMWRMDMNVKRINYENSSSTNAGYLVGLTEFVLAIHSSGNPLLARDHQGFMQKFHQYFFQEFYQ